MNTQNGWSIIQASDKTLDRSNIPGTNVQPAPGLRKGDAAVVLHEVGRLFDKNVQKLVKGWAWGWAQPQVLPGGTYSNHGSGTAIDLNAPNFPMGLSRMNSKQIAACRQIVKDMDGVVRWGGEYPGANIDQMHFEIVGNASQVKALADKIKSGGGYKMQRTALNRLIKAMLNRDATDEDRKKYLNKDPNQVIIDIDDWARKNKRTYSQEVTAKNKEIAELKKQSNTDADKKLAEVRKIVN